MIFVIVGSAYPPQAKAESTQSVPLIVEVSLNIGVTDVNLPQDTATVRIFVSIDNFPKNITSLYPEISGTGLTVVQCNNTNPQSKGPYVFQGESDAVSWGLEGYGANYPFDSYEAGFNVQYVSLFPQANYAILENYSEAYFNGPNILSLTDLWVTNSGNGIPVTWTPVSNFPFNSTSQETTQEMVLSIQRSSNGISFAALEFLTPIIACYYLLGSTLLLDPKKQLNERLAIMSLYSYLFQLSSLRFRIIFLSDLLFRSQNCFWQTWL
jgi:hypothetical protein